MIIMGTKKVDETIQVKEVNLFEEDESLHNDPQSDSNSRVQPSETDVSYYVFHFTFYCFR